MAENACFLINICSGYPVFRSNALHAKVSGSISGISKHGWERTLSEILESHYYSLQIILKEMDNWCDWVYGSFPYLNTKYLCLVNLGTVDVHFRRKYAWMERQAIFRLLLPCALLTKVLILHDAHAPTDCYFAYYQYSTKFYMALYKEWD